jgi:hydroxymethylpyrimidine pyrophosphatase-like HAD family hydrolase
MRQKFRPIQNSLDCIGDINAIKTMAKAKAKAICFDLDGTILFNFCTPLENENIIETLYSFTEIGYEVVINSARTLEKMVQMLPILKKIYSKIVIIADSGKEIVVHGKRDLDWALYFDSIPKINSNNLEFVTNMLKRHSIPFHLTNHVNDVYANIKVETPISLVIESDINKALYFKGLFVKSGYDNLKIVSSLVNKGTAYMWWKQHRGIIAFDIGIGNSVLDKLFIDCCRCKYLINYKCKRNLNGYMFIDINNYNDLQHFLKDLLDSYG